jgi:hypothetical protein
VTDAEVPVGAFERRSLAICFIGQIEADDIYNSDSFGQHTPVTLWPFSPDVTLQIAVFPFCTYNFCTLAGTADIPVSSMLETSLRRQFVSLVARFQNLRRKVSCALLNPFALLMLHCSGASYNTVFAH